MGLVIVADAKSLGGMQIIAPTHFAVAGVITFSLGNAIQLLYRKVCHTKRGQFKVIEIRKLPSVFD